MKKFIFSALLVICIFCMLYVFLCKYVFKSYYEVNKELPDNMSLGKILAEYAVNTVEENSGKEFNVGEIRAQVDSTLKGKVRFILVEKKQRKPLLAYVDFDTKNNKLLSYNYVSWHSKLDPGLISFQDWEIDYAEAIEISEKFFSQTDDFRYDSVLIESYNPHPSKDENGEDWLVNFFDDQGEKKYYTRVDPYTGEITVHSISNYFSNY